MNKIKVEVELELPKHYKTCSEILGNKAFCRFCNYGYCNLFEQDLDEFFERCRRLPECIAAQNKNKKGRG